MDTCVGMQRATVQADGRPQLPEWALTPFADPGQLKVGFFSMNVGGITFLVTPCSVADAGGLDGLPHLLEFFMSVNSKLCYRSLKCSWAGGENLLHRKVVVPVFTWLWFRGSISAN